ncbi:MAG TPA: bifunctional phosphoribosyl-AMP cyclohydrolase/phosphoribosyl-ATP diphosphatase HisIE [Atribacteraceae bacterium]|nr:bifunctional phosphoribosyl-AMP cyclohydrolase/phosphoribosyl-ATP diphosphatase HisIE [Atribacteraceae bacterium]
MEKIFEQVKFSQDGLIPAVVQDAESGKVLMTAYMNRESLKKTLETGTTWFFSRSRGCLWHKGETSGHTQRVTGLYLDCDGDSLLVQVEQKGVACHTGELSCYYREITDQGVMPETGSLPPFASAAFLQELFQVIEERSQESAASSYTRQLLEAPREKVLRKISEESTEVLLACMSAEDKALIKWEVADLLYHLLVLVKKENLTFYDIIAELQKRRKRVATSGKSDL